MIQTITKKEVNDPLKASVKGHNNHGSLSREPPFSP